MQVAKYGDAATCSLVCSQRIWIWTWRSSSWPAAPTHGLARAQSLVSMSSLCAVQLLSVSFSGGAVVVVSLSCLSAGAYLPTPTCCTLCLTLALTDCAGWQLSHWWTPGKTRLIEPRDFRPHWFNQEFGEPAGLCAELGC